MKIHKLERDNGRVKIEYWYPHVRVWYAIRVDEQGNQMGNTIDSYRKTNLLDAINRGWLDLAGENKW